MQQLNLAEWVFSPPLANIQFWVIVFCILLLYYYQRWNWSSQMLIMHEIPETGSISKAYRSTWSPGGTGLQPFHCQWDWPNVPTPFAPLAKLGDRVSKRLGCWAAWDITFRPLLELVAAKVVGTNANGRSGGQVGELAPNFQCSFCWTEETWS